MNYCVTRKELLAIMYFTRYIRQCLLGRKFAIRTDHAALSCLKKTPEPIGQNARWLENLEYNFVVQHRPGLRHGNADTMSRRPCLNRPSCTACHPEALNCASVEVGSPIFFRRARQSAYWTNEEIAAAQRADRDTGTIISLLGQRP